MGSALGDGRERVEVSFVPWGDAIVLTDAPPGPTVRQVELTTGAMELSWHGPGSMTATSVAASRGRALSATAREVDRGAVWRLRA